MTKYIFITGGVVSSLGKGLVSASIATLLQSRGYKVRLRKLDPYLNVDPGTMSPIEHGEVFVTNDGAETDLDLGHYERFTGVESRKGDNITSGKIYSNLLLKERRGDYLGVTVQVIPHVTNLIKDFIKKDTENEDFVLCEIGGTVGDIEALPYFEALRQMSYEHKEDIMYIHLTLIPLLNTTKELKTKPTQHSIKELRSIGIQPDLILCRSEIELEQSDINKIALFCNVPTDMVTTAIDVDNIYKIPMEYYNRNIDLKILKHFNIKSYNEAKLDNWKNLVNKLNQPNLREVTISVVGKYTGLKDAYKSYVEAFIHAGIDNNVNVNINWIDSRLYCNNNNDLKNDVKNSHAIMIPGGFGTEGITGKIAMIKYARENNVPFLGICLGMQLMVVEFARNILNIEDAHSTEFNPDCKNPIIARMEEWNKNNDDNSIIVKDSSHKGGTMRLGAYDCYIKDQDSLAFKIYQKHKISERHRHRFELNINYKEQLEKGGMMLSGMSEDNKLTEIVEFKNHPWFLGVQFHPELKSNPFNTHKIFNSLIKAAIEYRDNNA